MLSLAANENPLGMPACAREAVAAVLAGGSAGCYPDGTGMALRRALAQRLGVEPDWVTLGSGSSELLELAAQVCLEPGQSAVYSQYGFIAYGVVVGNARARAIAVPARDFGHDLAAMLAAVQPDTRLLFVANPNNPTGSFVPGPALLDFIGRVPPQVTVVLDEAYTEYLAPDQRYDSIPWTRRFANLLVTRTFSKAYGLAGLRIGYAVGQPVLSARLNARRLRFNVTSPALAAAQAALADADWLRRTYETNLAGRGQLSEGLAALGLRVLPSSGNFVLVHVGAAQAVHARMLEAGIAVSLLDNYGLAGWLRISVGLPEQNARVLDCLRGAMTGQTTQEGDKR